MSIDSKLIVFALNSSRNTGERLAARLGIPLALHEERDFGFGEHKTRPLTEVANRDVYVVQSLHGDPSQSSNDKLVRLLFFIGALKDAGAQKVTAVTPYLAYNRKDRRTKPRDPVNSRYIAALFESMGTDRIAAIEVHNIAAFENAFRNCHTVHIPTAGVLADYFASIIGENPVAVVSPDSGGNKRAELFRHELELRLKRPIGKGIMDKHRSMGTVSGSLFAGDVANCQAIIIDDLISSGTTIMRATEACRKAGAAKIFAAAAHGMFTSDAGPLFSIDGPDQIVVTNSIPMPANLEAHTLTNVTVVSVTDLLADIIQRLHNGDSVSNLIPYD